MDINSEKSAMDEYKELDTVGLAEKVEIISTDDAKIKSIGELLSSDSSRNILKLLFEEVLTANQIAQKTGTSLPLVIYHLKKMQEMGIVKITNVGKNVKAQDMKYYTTSKFAIVILPSSLTEKAKTSRSLANSFKTIYRFASIGVAAVATWFVSQTSQKLQPITQNIPTATPQAKVSAPAAINGFGAASSNTAANTAAQLSPSAAPAAAPSAANTAASSVPSAANTAASSVPSAAPTYAPLAANHAPSVATTPAPSAATTAAQSAQSAVTTSAPPAATLNAPSVATTAAPSVTNTTAPSVATTGVQPVANNGSQLAAPTAAPSGAEHQVIHATPAAAPLGAGIEIDMLWSAILTLSVVVIGLVIERVLRAYRH